MFAIGFLLFLYQFSVSHIDRCEIHVSKDVSAGLLTSLCLNEVPRVKRLSLCKAGNKLSLEVQDCHLDEFEIEGKRNKPFFILVCVRV